MKTKMFGGVLMILGTSVGAGMLALPVASAQGGFFTSALMLIACWMTMTLGAFLLLEVSLWLPKGTNLISMAGITLGRKGQVLTWVAYLLLLYSLLCAYISGNSDILQSLLSIVHINIPQWVAAIIVVLIFGAIVHKGIYSVDIVNRALMSTKIIAYFVLVLMVSPHIDFNKLLSGPSKIHIATIMVMVTSFGYAIIVPSLRTYFGREVNKLRLVIFIGSLLPLVIYLIWIMIIQGLIPKFGDGGLIYMYHSGHAASLLMADLSQRVNNVWLSKISTLFISICAMTSFLGALLCLVDFLSDGIKMKRESNKSYLIYLLAFAPPLLIIFFAPGIFIKALAYAGLFCVLILIILPILMAYSGRYHRKIANGYRVMGGRFILLIGMAFAIGVIIWSFI